jgi:hypothetical protein
MEEDMLRQLGRLALILSIAAPPAFAARGRQLPSKPALGQVVRSSSATLGGTALPSGGTIVAGDVLSTAAGGSALVEFSAGNQIELGESSIVNFSGTQDRVLATVDHGSVTVSVATPGAVATATLLCRVSTSEQGSASYSVTAPPGSTSATVKALRGTVTTAEIGSGQSHLVNEGETWACPAAVGAQAREEGAPGPGEQAGQAPAPAVSKHSNTGLLVVLIGGGVAGGIAAALAGGKGGGGGAPASPSAP